MLLQSQGPTNSFLHGKANIDHAVADTCIRQALNRVVQLVFLFVSVQLRNATYHYEALKLEQEKLAQLLQAKQEKLAQLLQTERASAAELGHRVGAAKVSAVCLLHYRIQSHSPAAVVNASTASVWGGLCNGLTPQLA
jgi:hypothetical protein